MVKTWRASWSRTDIGVRRKMRYEVKRIDEGYFDLESL